MTSEKLVYVIDIGTNSIRLMRARAEGDSVRCLDKTIRTVRTGEGVNANGYLLEAAIDRSLDVLSEYKRMAEAEGAQEVYCFATSAVRDSSNSEHFVQRAERECGVHIEILSGAEEAACGVAGVLPPGGNGGIIDIGGGSTEIVFSREGEISYLKSFNIGSVRGLEIFCGRDTQGAVFWAREQLSKAPWKEAEGIPFYGIGGTATSLAAVDLQLQEYDPRKVDGHILTSARAEEMLVWLSSKTVEERRRITGMEYKRADVIIYGLSVLVAFFRESAVGQIIVSEADNLEGYLLRLRKKQSSTEKILDFE